MTKFQPYMLTPENKGENEHVIKSPNKPKVVIPSINGFNVTPDRNLKEREAQRHFLNWAKNLSDRRFRAQIPRKPNLNGEAKRQLRVTHAEEIF